MKILRNDVDYYINILRLRIVAGRTISVPYYIGMTRYVIEYQLRLSEDGSYVECRDRSHPSDYGEWANIRTLLSTVRNITKTLITLCDGCVE